MVGTFRIKLSIMFIYLFFFIQINDFVSTIRYIVTLINLYENGIFKQNMKRNLFLKEVKNGITSNLVCFLEIQFNIISVGLDIFYENKPPIHATIYSYVSRIIRRCREELGLLCHYT